MRGMRIWLALGLAVAVAAAVAVYAGTATGKGKAGQTIIIGAAVDLTSSMKPFDSPALAGAQIEAKNLAAAGGPNFQIKVCNHQLKKQKSCAAQLKQAGQDPRQAQLVPQPPEHQAGPHTPRRQHPRVAGAVLGEDGGVAEELAQRGRQRVGVGQ